ncbi:MAG: DegT/DnrJ/EryC1/StrS family aminotransferase [Pseudarcicella sp.]|nr:DegT/DnrJ/EryC1/StrS family aminotransferase [Pseudarcicella sp.]MBP6410303.1 DegT/DnrJ/EryC1/StrS family aminotransferase [Pseudarcicella sp.]
MINVTKTFLPDIQEYKAYLEGIWERGQLTNNGPLVKELELKLAEFLGVKHCFFVSNGTIALQIALKVLNITKEVITTPFSYCATSHAIFWENCTPVFVDISPDDFCIDVSKIEAAITPNTQAILATHVYGNPCDIEAIKILADKHNLKVIYDGAHAFGVSEGNNSLLKHGDISTCSFHSTKVFHTIEGGAIITEDDDMAYLIDRYRSFGHIGDDYITVGINGKNSEFHAAMGLCNLNHFKDIVASRKSISDFYDKNLDFTSLKKPIVKSQIISNYAYYPVFFETESKLLQVKNALESNKIYPRRYFYPSLSTLKFISPQSNCLISDDIATKALALPLYYDLELKDQSYICKIINQQLQRI